MSRLLLVGSALVVVAGLAALLLLGFLRELDAAARCASMGGC